VVYLIRWSFGLGSCGEGVEAGLGHLVVLLGQDGADEADDRPPVGEDPNDVDSTADLAIESLVGTRAGARWTSGTR
jgi:hypothetical protein